MTAGRPSSYDPAYCDRVLELGAQGASVVEMAHELAVTRTTLETNWPAAHPEFMEALERARMASQVWWEKKGRENLNVQGFSASVWSRSMAARFPRDWREKVGHVGGDEGDSPIQVQDLTVSKAKLMAAGLSEEKALRLIAGGDEEK